MWDEYKELTPEERLDRIVEILTEGVLRLINDKNTSSARINSAGKPSNSSGCSSEKRIKDVSKKDLTSI